MTIPDNLQGKTFADRPEDRNLAGRPKGSRNRSTIVREAIEAIMDGDNQQIVDKMTAAIIKKAMDGDVQAYKELLDSGYGKNTDKLQHGGDADNPVGLKISWEK